MLVDYVQRELADGSRTVVETEHWLAVVPYWAARPFETLLLPKAHVLRITDLTDAQRSDLALALKKLTSRYDNLFQCSFPTLWAGTARHLMAKRINTGSCTRTFIRLCCALPPYVNLWLVMKCWQKPSGILTAEQAAERLRAVSDIHFRESGVRNESERKTQSLFANAFGYPATHTIQAPAA